MRMLSQYEPGKLSKSPRDLVRKRGYVVLGDHAYQATGEEVARTIDIDRQGKSILFLPVTSGIKNNDSFGNAVEDGFGMLGVPYRRLPAKVSKFLRRVQRPYVDEVRDNAASLLSEYGKGIIAIAYDDTVLGGVRLLTLYGFLRDCKEMYGFPFDDIKLAAFIDRKGITDYQSMQMAPDLVNRDDALEGLRSQTIAQVLVDALYNRLPKRVPEPEEWLRRIMIL